MCEAWVAVGKVACLLAALTGLPLPAPSFRLAVGCWGGWSAAGEAGRALKKSFTVRGALHSVLHLSGGKVVRGVANRDVVAEPCVLLRRDLARFWPRADRRWSASGLLAQVFRSIAQQQGPCLKLEDLHKELHMESVPSTTWNLHHLSFSWCRADKPGMSNADPSGQHRVVLEHHVTSKMPVGISQSQDHGHGPCPGPCLKALVREAWCTGVGASTVLCMVAPRAAACSAALLACPGAAPLPVLARTWAAWSCSTTSGSSLAG